MIYANNKDALRYQGIHPDLDLALKQITPTFLAGLGDDRVAIRGDDIYCFKVTFDTIPEEKALFENHKLYIDIHIVLQGVEMMETARPETLEQCGQRPENDAYFYRGKGHHRLVLTPGNFLVAFPEDAHKTQMMVDRPLPVTKAVFKIRL